jgi:alcohol dehydrogenase class IV
MRFEFTTSPQVYFGAGVVSVLTGVAKGLGRRALLVTGKRSQPATQLVQRCFGDSIELQAFAVPTEPTLETVAAGLAAARAAKVDFVVAMGGGSAIDTAKAISGLLTNGGELMDYLEVVGKGQPLERPSLPWIAIPTTSGTGAEVTRNAVVAVPERGVKVSFRSPHLLARAAIVDPALTLELPPDITAATGMDALTQLIEARLSHRATPLTNAVCDAALPGTARALRDILRDPRNVELRSALSFGSLCSGMALNNAGLGAVHGFAAALGGMYHAAHGAICARMLAPVLRTNLAALRRTGDERSLATFTTISNAVCDRPESSAEELPEAIEDLVVQLSIPRLRDIGVQAADFEEIVRRTQNASSTRGNPVPLTAEELRRALEAAF